MDSIEPNTVSQVAQLPLIAELPDGFLREFEAEILGRVPAEKIKQQLEMEKTARIMRQAGSTMMEGLGQKIAQIPARLYFRMLHDMGKGNAGDSNWLDDLLADNPALCAPGYRPKQNGARHGFTFVGGKCVSATKGKVQS